MYPRLTTTARRASVLAVAIITVGAYGTTSVAEATPAGAATSAVPTTCEVMAEEDAMAESTDAMAEPTDAMAEEDAMAESTDAMAESTDAMAEEEAMAESTDAMAEEDAMAETGDLLAVAGDAELSTFVAAIEAAELSELLMGESPLTVFAPSNEAFATYLSETGVDEASLLADTEALSALVSGHVIEGELTADALVAADGLCFATVAGTELPITFDGVSAVVGPAVVLDAGHAATNGILYTVDHVITG